MADKNFKVKNGLDIGDNVATFVTKVVINSASETTLDSVLTGTTKSVDYSLTLFQDAGVVGKKIFATENGSGASIQEYASISVSREEYIKPNDASTWVTRTSNVDADTFLFGVAHGGNLWVAAGQTTKALISTDGATWVSHSIGMSGNIMRTVAYGNGLFAVAGETVNINQDITFSTDGITWVSRTSNFGNTDIESVAYGNNLWVAGGYSGQLRTSTDTITWTTRTSNFGNTVIRSVAYGNNLWVAAGGNPGELRSSTDAITWVTRTSNVNTAIFSVAYGNNLWVASGYYGQLRTSTDAITWVTRTSNFGTTGIKAVAYGDNLWVAAGYTGQIRRENELERALKLTATVTNAGVSGSEATAILKKETVVA